MICTHGLSRSYRNDSTWQINHSDDGQYTHTGRITTVFLSELSHNFVLSLSVLLKLLEIMVALPLEQRGDLLLFRQQLPIDLNCVSRQKEEVLPEISCFELWTATLPPSSECTQFPFSCLVKREPPDLPVSGCGRSILHRSVGNCSYRKLHTSPQTCIRCPELNQGTG